MSSSPIRPDAASPPAILVGFSPRDHAIGLSRVMEPLPPEVAAVLQRMLAAGEGAFSSMRWHVETGRAARCGISSG